MRDEGKQKENERKFDRWEELSDGGRRYYLELQGRYGWKARYIKEVDVLETTVKFYQEIYDEHGQLVEVHQKYPVDLGHVKIKENK
ncbi:MAG: hypothetical protein JRH18_18220 [Deltaproteobacteria bacterium]|nr:hypothetical protein [Deltaproteobacteria bacterium]MBW1961879.1 hypothetical protein [Deltaproteobacteria bacterium]MBW1994049.1 hypothetical protein [Deltaproteobacteria bacterium]MBW2153593.1 hypothetical protein [Deltaproteobacteria bacterium]